MMRRSYSASCDGCGVLFIDEVVPTHFVENSEVIVSQTVHRFAVVGSHFADRDALLLALGRRGWGILFGDTSDIDAGSLVCTGCRGGAS